MTEVLVNGGRNYELNSDHCSYVNKLGYMLEYPVYLVVLVRLIVRGVSTTFTKEALDLNQSSSDNPSSADNQQERPSNRCEKFNFKLRSDGILRDYTPSHLIYI